MEREHLGVGGGRKSACVSFLKRSSSFSKAVLGGGQKTVKDMLRKVVGVKLVDDNTEFISAEVDRIISSDVASLVAKYMAAEKLTSGAAK